MRMSPRDANRLAAVTCMYTAGTCAYICRQALSGSWVQAPRVRAQGFWGGVMALYGSGRSLKEGLNIQCMWCEWGFACFGFGLGREGTDGGVLRTGNGV